MKVVKTQEEIRKIEIEESLDTLAHYLDGLFRIPGTKWRFGLDAIVGLIPNFGDTLTTLVSFYILIAGVRYGVPKITILRMAINIAIDYLAGIIPFFGDIFDFFWKTNQRNLKLIRERATKKDSGTFGDYAFVFGIVGALILLLVFSILASIYLITAIIGKIWQFFY
ncbi:MAG: DUF4112 domain-containing protein [Pyrinomonadaceae bacterium]|nr:DUF4112 domain-containing protein [Pyrinomonadaceae bacterium]MCX7639975.1 DUF4112 domain-containing protein [Pyrinomonadaceae bacterium]MDW8304147.1 DUF4112 domain-containing protein [Acidobacteriota bacterium]